MNSGLQLLSQVSPDDLFSQKDCAVQIISSWEKFPSLRPAEVSPQPGKAFVLVPRCKTSIIFNKNLKLDFGPPCQQRRPLQSR